MTAAAGGFRPGPRAGVLFHPRVPESRALADRLAASLTAAGAACDVADAWHDVDALERTVRGSDWLVVLGGDGTMLRVARLAAAADVPLIGVNFGRLGFLTEVEPADAEAAVHRVAVGEAVVEPRVLLRCTGHIGGQAIGPLDAVNDVFVGRGRVSRPVRLDASIDGTPYLRYFADGLIVATPTGSTAYSLSAGGPVVDPAMAALVVTPVVPHPVPVKTLVLAAERAIDIVVRTDYDAILAVDGGPAHDLADGDHVRIVLSPHRARFLRLGPSASFYAGLVERLQRGKSVRPRDGSPEGGA
mgnify:CR=1 FL=1